MSLFFPFSGEKMNSVGEMAHQLDSLTQHNVKSSSLSVIWTVRHVKSHSTCGGKRAISMSYCFWSRLSAFIQWKLKTILNSLQIAPLNMFAIWILTMDWWERGYEKRTMNHCSQEFYHYLLALCFIGYHRTVTKIKLLLLRFCSSRFLWYIHSTYRHNSLNMNKCSYHKWIILGV